MLRTTLLPLKLSLTTMITLNYYMQFIYLGHRNVTEGVPKEGDLNPEQSGVTAIRDKKKKKKKLARTSQSH